MRETRRTSRRETKRGEADPTGAPLESYAFTWPGRREAERAWQTPAHTALVAAPEESPAADGHRAAQSDSGNLFVEGENLEALKLLQPEYAGRVKMIYIDPPYNTGGKFTYADNLDAEWLSMMYPRLYLAREFLRADGAIFVSIDDHELHHLRLLMNEVFGAECFKNCIVFRRGVKSVQAQFETTATLGVGHEYVLFYARSPGTRFQQLRVPRAKAKPGTWNNHWRGTDRPTMRYPLFGITPERGQWRWSKERSLRAVENYERMLRELSLVESGEPPQARIDEWWLACRERTGERLNLLRLSATGKPEHYVPPSASKLGSDLWTDLTTRGTAELDRLFGGVRVFDNPKPVALVKRMLMFATEPGAGDIVLDFFAGSCTTAQAVVEMNHEDGGHRRFIMVQMAEPLTKEVTLPDNAVVLRTIADVGRERIRRVLARMEDDGRPAPQGTGFRVLRVEKTGSSQ